MDSFDGVPNFVPSNINQGQLRFGLTTVATCQSACQADVNCIRFAFITNTQLVGGDSNRVCYLFNSRAPPFVPGAGGTVYLRRKCQPLCVTPPTTGTPPPLFFKLLAQLNFSHRVDRWASVCLLSRLAVRKTCTLAWQTLITNLNQSHPGLLKPAERRERHGSLHVDGLLSKVTLL